MLPFLGVIARKAKRKGLKRHIVIAIISLNDGMRASELTGLKLTDIDLYNNQLKGTRKGKE
jgi:integrase